MSSVVLTGDTSGAGTITVPAVAGTFTATIGSATGTHYPFTAGTAVASTSGTSIDFTSIPSWVKRITVMFQGVSTNGSSHVLVQLGVSGTPTSSGYTSSSAIVASTNLVSSTSSTAGFVVFDGSASNTFSAVVTVLNITGNKWVAASNGTLVGYTMSGGGDVSLGGTANMVRITTVNGTDTFDAGSINILYE